MQQEVIISRLFSLALFLFIGAMLAATPVLAEAPKLSFPLDCTLGETCWVARYMDRAPGDTKADYTGGAQTQDKHKGTDFVLEDLGAMARGVKVKAALSGTVFRLRDGVDDIALDPSNRSTIKGKECGNAIILAHADGWQTQYCHLKKGSIAVKVGDAVTKGQAIAQVGLSGETEFPHLHFMVRSNKPGERPVDIDPFDGGVFELEKLGDNDPEPLWEEALAYKDTVLLTPLITATRTDRRSMWQEQTPSMPTSSEAIIIQARGFHTKAEDIWRFTLVQPNGEVRFTRDITQKYTRQLVQAFAGIRRPATVFAPGIWSATVTLIRDGKTLGSTSQQIRVEPLGHQ